MFKDTLIMLQMQEKANLFGRSRMFQKEGSKSPEIGEIRRNPTRGKWSSRARSNLLKDGNAIRPFQGAVVYSL
jgi:hypothetical protein